MKIWKLLALWLLGVPLGMVILLWAVFGVGR